MAFELGKDRSRGRQSRRKASHISATDRRNQASYGTGHLLDGFDRQGLPLPAERRRAFGISIARMTLDQVSRHAFRRPVAHSQSRRQKTITTTTAASRE